jgi:WD40 repeat protein
MIACASFDGTVVVWEARDSSLQHWDQVASLDGHENEVKSVAWSPVGFWVATCGRDKKIWVWEQEDEFECVSMLDGHTQDVKFVTWHPTEALLFSGSYDDTIKVWQEDDDEFYCTQTLDSHEDTVWGISIQPRRGNEGEGSNSSGNNRMISCCADGSVKLWESDEPHGKGTWRDVHTVRSLHRFPVYSVHWGEHYIATGGGDNAICLLEVKKDGSGAAALGVVDGGRVLGAHKGDVNCVRFGPRVHDRNNANNNDGDDDDDDDGGGKMSGSGHLMDQETVFRVPAAGAPAPTDMLLASCGDDGLVKIWRLAEP